MDINILLKKGSHQKKYDACQRIINNLGEKYANTFLNPYMIMHIFSRDEYMFHVYKFLLNTLLNTNKGMFVAIVNSEKSYFNNNVGCFVGWSQSGYNIGWYRRLDQSDENYNSIAIREYKNLLDYCNFDTENLVLSENVKSEIQTYQREKYTGTATKPVN